MSFYLADLDGQLARHSMMDPTRTQSTLQLSHLAAKRAELSRALAERRRNRRATKSRASRSRRQPVARPA